MLNHLTEKALFRIFGCGSVEDIVYIRTWTAVHGTVYMYMEPCIVLLFRNVLLFFSHIVALFLGQFCSVALIDYFYQFLIMYFYRLVVSLVSFYR